MNRGGNGTGSASIVLIFAILCMTIFSLISLQTALSDKALADAQERYVKEYYAADTRAEMVLFEIMHADFIPETVSGIAVNTYTDDFLMEIVQFTCPINESKELSVEAVIYDGAADIMKWRIQDEGVWEYSDDFDENPLFQSGNNPWD